MVRVPTYASYMSLLNQTMNTKSMLDLYSYQSNTGIKSPTYAGFGMSAYSIVSLEASLKVTSNFMENNKILNTELETMNTAMESRVKISQRLQKYAELFRRYGFGIADSGLRRRRNQLYQQR